MNWNRKPVHPLGTRLGGSLGLWNQSPGETGLFPALEKHRAGVGILTFPWLSASVSELSSMNERVATLSQVLNVFSHFKTAAIHFGLSLAHTVSSSIWSK